MLCPILEISKVIAKYARQLGYQFSRNQQNLIAGFIYKIARFFFFAEGINSVTHDMDALVLYMIAQLIVPKKYYKKREK